MERRREWTIDGPALRTLDVYNTSGAGGKYYVWVQSNAAPPDDYYYTQAGVAGRTPTLDAITPNNTKPGTWTGLPAGQYTVYWSVKSDGVPIKASQTVDLTADDGLVNLP